MKLISFNFSLFLILHISHATAQVNTERMRNENVEKTFTSKFKLDFGYETSKDEIFDILFTASSNFYIQNNLHAFLVMDYQNGFISNNQFIDFNYIISAFNNHIKKKLFLIKFKLHFSPNC